MTDGAIDPAIDRAMGAVTDDGPTTHRLRSRRPGVAFDEIDPLGWHARMPEFACATAAVSILMPHAGPYVVASDERVLDQLDDELRPATSAYVRQERQHHGQHRRFNEIIMAANPGAAWLDRVPAKVFAFLGRRSPAFGVAFAAGFETIAFAGARWVEPRIGTLFGDGEEGAARLFLWHLAEEVEHKAVAHDVWRATDGSRLRYLWAMTVAALVLAVFSFVGTLTLLRSLGRLHSPVAHGRLALWSLTFVFEAVTTMVISCLPGHHPDDLTDPIYFATWLRTN